MIPARLLGFSVLSPFRPGSPDWRPALDYARAVGHRRGVTPIVRVFCGPLPWCGQTRELVYAGLDRFCIDAAERDLHVLPSFCTEAGTGYDLQAHVNELEGIVRRRRNVGLREVGNEPWHGTQGGRLSPEICRELSRWLGGAVAYGAAQDDEALDYAGGRWVPIHQARGRDRWNRVRRVREMLRIIELTGKPALSQESIGADEVAEPGRRDNDPAAFFCEGVLNRLFETAGVIGHSQTGLHALPPAPGSQQDRCLRALADGLCLWGSPERLTYKNTGWTDGTAPIRSADLIDDAHNPGGSIVRLYAGVTDDGRRGMLVGVGLHGTDEARWRIETQHGWERRAVIADVPSIDGVTHCRVWYIAR